MPTELRYDDNPFESPIKTRTSSTPTTISEPRTQQPNVLATADLLREQLQHLENLCSTAEERVQRKRQALKELEYLIKLGSNSEEGSLCSPPVYPANTPIGSRLRLVSPRLRGLFDLRGPGQANVDAVQSCLDYSPELLVEDNVLAREDPSHSDEWVDDEEEGLLSCSPFDDKYALQSSPRKVEKRLPAIPRDGAGEVMQSKIPRKAHVRRQASTSRRLTGRSPNAVARNNSYRRRSSAHSVKTTNAAFDLPKTKGTMRRGSWKRSILENAKTKGGAKAIENEMKNERDGARSRKERKKGLWSIYSVCSELGLSGTPRAI